MLITIVICTAVALLIGFCAGLFMGRLDREVEHLPGLFGAPIDAPFHFRGVPSRTLCGRCGLYHPEN